VGFTWQAHGRFVRSASWEGAPDEEMDTDVALRFGREPTLLLAGERRKGSRVPMLAAARNGKVIWRTNLPTTNLLAAEEGDPSGSTLTAERAYATYSYADNSGFALVAIAMKDGAHLWETRVPRKSDPGSLTLSVDDNCIFVFSSGAMHCLSATGKLLWSVGWGLGH
jgi:outer membrane protein assembly factor BamB